MCASTTRRPSSTTRVCFRPSTQTRRNGSARSRRRWPRLGWLGCEVREAPAATERELELVHTARAGRRRSGTCAPPVAVRSTWTRIVGRPRTRRRCMPPGACEMVRALTRGEAEPASAPCDRQAITPSATARWGYACSTTSRSQAELAIRELGVERVMIIDWDVHHGNGTAEIFRRRRDVLFASIHQLGLFPGTGEVSDAGSAEGRGSTINVPVPHGDPTRRHGSPRSST